VSGEESASQVRLRGDRLEIREPRLFLLAETDVASIVARPKRGRPGFW
jgi:DNA repair protein RadA/Sms